MRSRRSCSPRSARIPPAVTEKDRGRDGPGSVLAVISACRRWSRRADRRHRGSPGAPCPGRRSRRRRVAAETVPGSDLRRGKACRGSAWNGMVTDFPGPASDVDGMVSPERPRCPRGGVRVGLGGRLARGRTNGSVKDDRARRCRRVAVRKAAERQLQFVRQSSRPGVCRREVLPRRRAVEPARIPPLVRRASAMAAGRRRSDEPAPFTVPLAAGLPCRREAAALACSTSSAPASVSAMRPLPSSRCCRWRRGRGRGAGACHARSATGRWCCSRCRSGQVPQAGLFWERGRPRRVHLLPAPPLPLRTVLSENFRMIFFGCSPVLDAAARLAVPGQADARGVRPDRVVSDLGVCSGAVEAGAGVEDDPARWMFDSWLPSNMMVPEALVLSSMNTSMPRRLAHGGLAGDTRGAGADVLDGLFVTMTGACCRRVRRR